MNPEDLEAVEDRFWDRADRGGPGECWEWTGATTAGGYGSVWLGGKAAYAHRVAYALSEGEAPGDGMVLHRCDNKPCVNPAHLYLGDNSDNMKDAIARGRLEPDPPLVRGEDHPDAKLTEEDVVEIRERVSAGESNRSIAEEKGVCHTTVSSVVHGRSWSHV